MTEPRPLVLIVEDERAIRQFVRAALMREGMSVFESETLSQAREDAKARRHDLLIVDLGLPDGDGVDLIREVRAASRLPIIVLSARSAEADKMRALDVGADDYVEKPFGISELLARVRANLRRHHADAPSVDAPVTIGDVMIDPAARIVKRAGREVHLTPIEYRLLEVLLANVGRVLTHRYLLREVWGPAHVEHNEYLRVFMRNLRHKLEEDPALP